MSSGSITRTRNEKQALHEKPVTQTVLAFKDFVFEGNIVPHTWYSHELLRYEPQNKRLARKPNSIAITLLADLCYWYRPVEVRDESSNTLLGYRRKFDGDMLQRSYSQWADFFGYTKGQIRDAVTFLKERGIIRVEYRTMTVKGMKLFNVVYMEPVPHVIRALNEGIPIEIEGKRYEVITAHPQDSSDIAPGLDVDTNTENTTEINSETTNDSYSPTFANAKDGLTEEHDITLQAIDRVGSSEVVDLPSDGTKGKASLPANSNANTARLHPAILSEAEQKSGGKKKEYVWLNHFNCGEYFKLLAQTFGFELKDWQPQRFAIEREAVNKINHVVPDAEIDDLVDFLCEWRDTFNPKLEHEPYISGYVPEFIYWFYHERLGDQTYDFTYEEFCDWVRGTDREEEDWF